jgi:hypothetical protein
VSDPFDVPHWCANIRDVYLKVFDDYPAGCLDWLRHSDPGRIEKLKASVDEAKHAYLTQDATALDQALQGYLGLHLGVFAEYRTKREKKRRTF